MPLILDPETTPLDLHGRLAKLRRKSRGVAALAGGMSLAAAVIAVVASVALADRAVHLPAPLRAALLVGLVVGIAFGIRRWIIAPWRAAGDELSLALQVEHQVPGLHDALASAVQFAADDATSPALREATTHFAVDRTRGMDFTELVEQKPVTRAGLSLLVAVFATVIFARGGLATGIARLFDPYGNHSWPTKTLLTVNAGEAIARGEPFELQAKLGGVWPDRLTLMLALDRAVPTEQSYGVSAETSEMMIRLEPARVPRSFRYRVTAGDADTGWRNVAVTVPPELVPLDGRSTPLVHLAYPKYCDLPSRDLPDGTGSIEAILGTVMNIRAATDRPIERASLQWRPNTPQAAASMVALAFADNFVTAALGDIPALHALTAPMPFAIATDRVRFAHDFTLLVSGSYEMAFADALGLAGRRRFDVRVLPDPSPTVVLEQPYSGGEGMEQMPGATFELKALIDDPMFAVRRVRLEYRTRPNEPARTLPLYDGDALAEALPRLLTLDTNVRQRLRPTRINLDRRVSLSSFHRTDGKPLAIGDKLTIAVIAEDFDDVSPTKLPGRSHDVEIKIVGRERFEARVNQARNEIAKALAELHKLQAEALDQSALAELKRRSTGQLAPEDRNRIARSESLQQQVRERLGDQRDGLLAAAERLRQMVIDNPGASPTLRSQSERVVSELERLAREVLEPVAPLLATARQETETIPPTERSTGALPDAVQRQRDAERSMRTLLDQLQSGQVVAALAADAAALAAEQQLLSRQRAELAPQLPTGADPRSLPETDQKALKQLQERQEQLARRAEAFQRQLEAQATATAKAADDEKLRSRTLDDSIGDTRDPRKAGELRRESEKAADKAESLRQEAEALNEARSAMRGGDNDATLPDQMNRAAEALGRNRMGEAQQRQDAANQQLDRLREALRDSDIPEAERIVKERLRAEKQVEKLVRDQEKLQERTLEAEKQADQLSKKKHLEELAREEEQLAERATDMARQLRREGQSAAAREMERAAGDMERARAQLERGQPAASEQDDALERLDDAAEQTRRDRKDAEDRLQREKMLKLADRLKGMGDRQANLSAETNRLFDTAKQAGGWSRSMQKSLTDLSRAEEALGKELDDLAEKNLAKYKVVRRLAEHAAGAMAEAATAIDEAKASGLAKENVDTDRASIRSAQEQASKHIAVLMDVLQTPKDEMAVAQPPDGREPGQGGQNPDNNGKPDEDAIPPLAQIKILRHMQADLNERTATLAKLYPDPAKWTVAQKSAIDKLRRAQVELADLFIEVVPEAPPAGEKP